MTACMVRLSLAHENDESSSSFSAKAVTMNSLRVDDDTLVNLHVRSP